MPISRFSIKHLSTGSYCVWRGSSQETPASVGHKDWSVLKWLIYRKLPIYRILKKWRQTDSGSVKHPHNLQAPETPKTFQHSWFHSVLTIKPRQNVCSRTQKQHFQLGYFMNGSSINSTLSFCVAIDVWMHKKLRETASSLMKCPRCWKLTTKLSTK